MTKEARSEKAFFKAIEKLKALGDSPGGKRLLASLVKRLFEKFYGDIERVLGSKVSSDDRHIIDDLCQQCFLTAYKELIRFRGKTWPQIKLWLIRIAVRSYYRLKKTEKRLPPLFPLEIDQADQKITLSEEEARQRERVLQTLIDLVIGRIDLLSDQYRDVLQLRFWESRTHEEISRILTDREEQIPLGPFGEDIFDLLDQGNLPEILLEEIRKKEISLSPKGKVKLLEQNLRWEILLTKATYLLQRAEEIIHFRKEFTKSNSKVSLHRAIIDIWGYLQEQFPEAPWEKF